MAQISQGNTNMNNANIYGELKIKDTDNTLKPVTTKAYVDDEIKKLNNTVVDLNKTNIKEASVQNNIITIQKGSGDTSTLVIDNVGHSNTAAQSDFSTKALQDKDGLQIDSSYLKITGGTVTGKITFNEHIFLASGIELW